MGATIGSQLELWIEFPNRRKLQTAQRHWQFNSGCTCVSHCWWILKLTDQYWIALITPCLPYLIDIFWSDFIYVFLQVQRHGSRLGVDHTRWGRTESLVSGSSFQVLPTKCCFFWVFYTMFSGNHGLQKPHPMIPSIQQNLKHCRLWNVTKSNRVCIFCDVGFTPCHKQLACWWLWKPMCGDFGDGLFQGSLEVKLPTIWTDEKQRWKESERREE